MVDVKERKGIWVQGGEGYIRFEGKCLCALVDHGRLASLHQRCEGTASRTPENFSNKPSGFHLVYSVHVGAEENQQKNILR